MDVTSHTLQTVHHFYKDMSGQLQQVRQHGSSTVPAAAARPLQSIAADQLAALPSRQSADQH